VVLKFGTTASLRKEARGVNWLRHFNLRQQLTLLITLSCGGALLVVCLLSLFNDWMRYRHDVARDLELTANLVGAGVAPGLAAGDAESVRATLRQLQADSSILAARVFTRDDRMVAEYVRAGAQTPPPALSRDGVPVFTAGTVHLSRPIMLGGAPVGMICLRANNRKWAAAAREHIINLLLAILGAFLAAILLGRYLQRRVSLPVSELLETARAVSTRHDYTLRVRPQGAAELAALAQTFNTMLAAIGEREQALRLANVELEHNSRQLEEELRNRRRAEQQVLAVSDRERHRIGQDLHDGLCQHLTGTAFACKVLEDKLRGRNLPEADDAAEIGELVETAIEQARQTARGLLPLPLDTEHGLESALHELASSIRNVFGVPCAFRAYGNTDPTDQTVATHLYRIAQEATHNAVRHGQPKRIEIALTQAEDRVELTVSDDGVGIPEVLPETNGLGLRIMAYRARSIGAELAVRRRDRTGGTIVTCRAPRAVTEA